MTLGGLALRLAALKNEGILQRTWLDSTKTKMLSALEYNAGEVAIVRIADLRSFHSITADFQALNPFNNLQLLNAWGISVSESTDYKKEAMAIAESFLDEKFQTEVAHVWGMVPVKTNGPSNSPYIDEAQKWIQGIAAFCLPLSDRLNSADYRVLMNLFREEIRKNQK